MAELDRTVTALLQRIQPGQREHASRLKRYDSAYDVYRASEPSAQGVKPWESKLRVPYGMQVIDTALVNIVGGVPKVKVTPRYPEGEMSSKALGLVLDYEIAADQFVTKTPTFAMQALIFGVTVARNRWLFQKTTKNVRVAQQDPMTGETTWTTEAQEIVLRDGPTFEPWSVYRCYWEPGAQDVDSAAYVATQSWLSKDDLLKNQYNPDTGTGLYRNVDALFAAGQGKQPEGTAQDRYLGLDTNRTKDKFLIEEIWTNDKLFVLGNGQVLLRAQDNPYDHGRKPIVIAQTRLDLFEMVGIGETELVDHLQQALWTVQNLRTDNLKLTVMRGVTYREGGVTDPNALELRPRFKWPVSDHDDVRPFEVQPLPPEAYEEENALLSRMQLVTGINPYVSGSDLQTVDQNTATGVTALQEVAGRLLRFKATQLQYKGYQPTFEMWGEMIQQFLDKPMAVKILGPGNAESWVTVSPQDIAGHFGYSLEGTEESLSRQQERGEALALLNAFAPLVQTGMVNLKPLLEKVASAYGFTNPQALIQQAPPPQAPAAPQPLPQPPPFGAQQQSQPQPGQGLSPALAGLFGGQ